MLIAPSCRTRFLTALCPPLVLASCGGGGDSSTSAPPVAFATAPAPTPTPTPTPTPIPSSLSQRLGSGPLLEVLRQGDVIGGPLVCVDGGVYATQPDGTTRLASVTGPLTSSFDNGVKISSQGTDSYSYETSNGFGGATFTAADKRESGGRLLTEFRKSDGQLQIANPLGFATLGMLSSGNSRFCFFAAGPTSGQLENTRLTMASGLIDGIAQISGTTYRLYASPLTATWNAAEGSADVEVMLQGRVPAFGALDSTTPIELGTLRLRIASNVSSITLGAAPSEDFFDCAYFAGGAGLGCKFDFVTAAGDRVVGALAADARSI